MTDGYDDIPSVIAGPVVRHTTRKEINLWIVLRDKPETDSVNIHIYLDRDGHSETESRTETRIVSIGDHCHIALIRCFFDITDPDTELVYYNPEMPGFTPEVLASICYQGEHFPSIRIPHKHTAIAQASCRKPHAECDKDQLKALAKEVRNTLTDTQRPSQLFLTGDQIYADDVAPALLKKLQDSALKLGIPTGRAPDQEQDRKLKEFLNHRYAVLSEKQGFTSGEKASHLVYPSEFLMMYLFAFGGSVSIASPRAFSRIRKVKPLLYIRPVDAKTLRTIRMQLSGQYKADIHRLKAFQRTAQNKVRRLLANTSTYMIFDDHEVTDDWNLSTENMRGLKNSPIGRYLYGNALAAYTLCQHWGNCPASSDALVDLAENLLSYPDATSNERQAPDALWQHDWGYSLNQHPPVFVLDTRTKRIYDKHGNTGLMSDESLSKLEGDIAGFPDTPVRIIVSPTPVYGLTGIEFVQRQTFRYFSDREAWIFHRRTFRKLVDTICAGDNLKNVIILSGDVHYAFLSRRIKKHAPDIYQFSSSASNNKPMMKSVGGINKVLKFFRSLFRKSQHLYLGVSIMKGRQKQTGEVHHVIDEQNTGILYLGTSGNPERAALLCSESGKVIYTLRR